jgi:hypothetical protein
MERPSFLYDLVHGKRVQNGRRGGLECTVDRHLHLSNEACLLVGAVCTPMAIATGIAPTRFLPRIDSVTFAPNSISFRVHFHEL